MKLPFLISVPHGGLRVPDEVRDLCILSAQEVEEDGDVGAAEIYASLSPEVDVFVTTDIARAVVDLNRPQDDRRKDGVVKTHTCWDVPVYREPLSENLARTLLDRYHRPYHMELTNQAASGVLLGIDCHTMAAKGPPVGPDPGQERPAACLSNADGTCPKEWIETLRRHLARTLGRTVNINEPFKGGFITRSHAKELPWLQLELSRGPFLSKAEKGEAVLAAMRALYKDAPWKSKEEK